MTSTPRPFRFAVQVSVGSGDPVPTTAATFREMARRTEALGYTTLFVGDHYVDRGRITQFLAPMAALGVAAGATTTLRLGGRVFCVDYHVPAILAKEMATLDVLTDGRVEVGLGAGWNPFEYESMGLTFHDGPQRVDKMVEVLALIRSHFSGELMDVRGDHAQAFGYAGVPLPAQRPHPPIMIGGGRKRVLSIAAREADIVGFANVPVLAVDDQGRTPRDVARERLSWVRAAAGDRFDALEFEASPYHLAVSDDTSDDLARLAARFTVGVDVIRDHPNILVGSVDEVEQQLLERRGELYNVSYVTVPEAQLDEFAPIVERLHGR